MKAKYQITAINPNNPVLANGQPCYYCFTFFTNSAMLTWMATDGQHYINKTIELI